MDVIIPYDLGRETRRAVVEDDLPLNVAEPNSPANHSPQEVYVEEINAHRDLIFGHLKGKSSLSILVDDHTRPTPARFAIPELLNIAEVSQIKDLRLVIAFGSHEFPPEEYLREKVGDAVYSELPVILHDAYSRKENRMVGYTRRGTPLLINRWVASSEAKISLGSIFPSTLAGFTGGGKMILPGVAYCTSIDYNHAMFKDSFSGEVDGNPMRDDMDEAGKLAGLDLTIDSVMNPEGRVVSLHIGDPITAHREGVKVSRGMYEKEVPRAAVVVAGCGCRDDIDFVHLAKALEVASLVCEEGGIIVLIGACRLGIRWPELITCIEEKTACPKNAQSRGDFEGEVFARCFVQRYSSIFLERTKRVFWVTDPEHKSTANALGFKFFGDLQSALNEAMEGRRASITVLPTASLLLPLPY
jgi:nickel-dependent lactate racemase